MERMRYCHACIYGIRAVSCIYPPIIDRRYTPQKMPKIIIETVSKYFNISYLRMKTKSRKGDVNKARQISMSLIMELAKPITLEKTGNFFNRDHTTVIAAIKHVKDLCDTDIKYKNQYTLLIERLSNHTLIN